jgi:phosphomannomutase
MTDPLAAARAWLAEDPDPDTQAELAELLRSDPEEAARRFAGTLQFGTAGLRGEVGAGPLRMNRSVVRRAAAGLASWLEATDPDARAAGVVIGYDARTKSDAFAEDTARVLAAAGIRAHLLPPLMPTPVLAFAITHLGAAAGVMVTASHNPPADNGYKVYLGTGCQIVPPVDAEIKAHIDAVGPLADVPLAPVDHPLIVRLGDEVVDAYLDFVPSVRLVPDAGDVLVAYTPMHGVGGRVALAAFERAGLPTPVVVEEQFSPDGTFPTVAFPNPEEPGAMDLLLALAARAGADVALANDPDADRLGAAIPTPEGGWRRLGGDEIGWLFADHILRHTTGDDRLVVTTLVSSSLLSRMAARHNVHFAETYTGFKWIGTTVLRRPDQRFVFGYEQALGYLVAPRPLDKDGITAAVLFAEVAALAKREGLTLQQRLDAIEAQYGRYRMAERSVRVDPAAAAGLIDALRGDPPTSLGGVVVERMTEIPEAGLLRFECAHGLRVQVRPSGTEPKVKLYGEGVGVDPGPALDELEARLAG